ncbi:putative PfkB family kinase [Roseibium sp. TrichSKD4]|uniref:PfkB family carbohydrate kinase n=1 Tax=Roseibium sp. TrichSKD4 TaxID=744980 RepID=UPI0001E56A24|nr:PfkB family carbohydrate kinase [Roseibium sp. TrichSKD4]EFO30734.1 putative PfkB family kinase [Roseibium sp. TrichSKD4]
MRPEPSAGNSKPVWCFGAVHLDTIVHADVELQQDTSTPARFHESLGGVATNVAVGLAKLGVCTELHGAVGQDDAAARIMSRLQETSVVPHLIERTKEATGRYCAFHQPDGQMAMACVEGRILETAPSTLFENAVRCAQDQTDMIWFADANLPVPVLQGIASAKQDRFLALDAVSVTKAGRLEAVLPACDLLFINRAEAAALLEGTRPTTSQDTVTALQHMGAGSVILTAGADGLYWAVERSTPQHLPALEVSAKDVTGAGDALIAGTLAALSRELGLETAIQYGRAAATRTLTSNGATAAKYSWDDLSQSL